ncbi:SLC13 family permease [Ureibacillus chungkukjangi]|uniref:SLC13 family permease n=1 Tax=Ureibacillus chungkukjangi TaxID=1202712 RepID=UPI00255A228B|nr:SLC13 family permease [Ureibacillus chungkukjangi]MCM3387612.1 SLC13 family permease [Ureibacillus chungkukjangi]
MQKRALLFIVIVLYLIFFIIPWEMNIKIQAIAALMIIQILWVGKVFPLAYSSLLVILLFSFHFFTYEETLTYLGSDVVWLLFSTFILSNALIDTGLANRMSLSILKLSRGASRTLLPISFASVFVISILVPSNVGKASLISSVLDSLIKSLGAIQNAKNLAKSLFIGITYLVPIAGAFIATGASSTIYAYSLFAQHGTTIHFLNWIYIFGVPIIIFAIFLWILFLFMYPPEAINREYLLTLIEEEIHKLGKMSRNEKKMLWIIGFTLLLWMTQDIHGYSIPLIGLLGACLTMLPGIGVWEWNQAKKSVNWDIILFFASTLMVSGMLIDTGTINWLSKYLNVLIDSQSPFVIVLILVLITSLLRIMFVNVLGFLAIMLPLAFTLGDTLSGVSALLLAKAVFLAGIPGFFFITQSPVHLISYSYGYFTERELFRVGVIASLVWVGIICLAFWVFW